MAHASVLSTLHKMERLDLCSNPETKSIYEELRSMESCLHSVYAQMKGNKLRFDPLEEQIEDAATQIEDLIERYYSSSDTKSHGNETRCNSFISNELFEVKQEISSLTVILNEFNKYYESMEGHPEIDKVGGYVDNAFSFSSRNSDVSRDMKLVGLQNEVENLLRWILVELFCDSKEPQIRSIVGMVGIGKTTLVKHVYNNPSVKSAFGCCLWVTIGPNYNSQEFIQLVSDQIGFPKRFRNLGMDKFGSFLYEYLNERRYLIVLDDVWSIQVFNNLRRIFPSNKNRSRIILTTRLFDIAQGVTDDVHEKRFLNDEDSWGLLHWMVFTTHGDRCSYDLQKYGKKIAKNCEGLPLAILAVGKHLCKSEKTVEYWKEVSEHDNLRDIIKDDYEKISGTLFLSYKMLPRRLKECFLYIGIVPTYKIFVATLIKLWCAEEFLRPQVNKSAEDVAREYLDELVSQTVVLVGEPSLRQGRIKICRVHFIFRYLCVSEAENEKFCLIVKKYVDCSRKGTSKQR